MFALAKIVTVAAVSLVIVIGQAAADVTHTVRFSVEPRIVVWGEVEGGIRADMPAMATRKASEMKAIPVITGTLEPLMADAKFVPNSYSAGKSFHVASNAAFAISAKADASAGDGRFAIAISELGENAQLPHDPAAGFVPGIDSLGDIAEARTIYNASRRTAMRKGTIASQSVRFDADWDNSASASAPASVTFTVFAP